jgi:hypothetical protein
MLPPALLAVPPEMLSEPVASEGRLSLNAAPAPPGSNLSQSLVVPTQRFPVTTRLSSVLRVFAADRYRLVSSVAERPLPHWIVPLVRIRKRSSASMSTPAVKTGSVSRSFTALKSVETRVLVTRLSVYTVRHRIPAVPRSIVLWIDGRREFVAISTPVPWVLKVRSPLLAVVWMVI